jgi:hypothetical protein
MSTGSLPSGSCQAGIALTGIAYSRSRSSGEMTGWFEVRVDGPAASPLPADRTGEAGGDGGVTKPGCWG